MSHIHNALNCAVHSLMYCSTLVDVLQYTR